MLTSDQWILTAAKNFTADWNNSDEVECDIDGAGAQIKGIKVKLLMDYLSKWIF